MDRIAAAFLGGAFATCGFLVAGQWYSPPDQPRFLLDTPALVRVEQQNVEFRTELWATRIRLADLEAEVSQLRDAARRAEVRVIPAADDPANLIPPQNVPVPRP